MGGRPSRTIRSRATEPTELDQPAFVTFADGETTRMSTATLPNRPLNAGRGLRLSVAAYEARQRRTGRLVPPIVACHFEREGEVIGRFDPAECNRHLGLA